MKVYVDTSIREEIGYGGGWLHTNVWAAGKLIATFDNHGGDNGLHFHLDDPLGTRCAQTDGFGTLEAQYASLPHGDGLETATGDPAENHFTGKERDTESGLDYFGARYYASNMGRFMSPDWAAKAEPVPYSKLDKPQTLNLYQYMRNNPLGGADPDGHCDWCQKLLNGISGNGFQTNAQIAAANAPTTITESETYSLRNPESTSEAEPREPNDHVDLAASAVGLLSAAQTLSPGLLLALAAGGVSSVNDPSGLNLSINGTGGALGILSYTAEGTAVSTAATGAGFGVAVGAMGWSASNWFTNRVLMPMASKANFNPNAPPTTGPHQRS